MLEPHQHSEVELNLVTKGHLTYLFGTQLERLSQGSLSVFWGTLPHRLLEMEPGSRYVVLTLPLASFLRYNLPDPLAYQLLHGVPVASLASPGVLEPDLSLLRRWQDDLMSRSSARLHIVELELEARLRRLNLSLVDRSLMDRSLKDRSLEHRSLEHRSLEHRAASRNPVRLQKALDLAAHIAAQYLGPLSLADLARKVGLHPHYASSLFREAFGQTPTQYLTQYRVAHAQRLLLTSSQTVIAVALESGFGSLSRFYSAFAWQCSQSPLEYRKAHLR